VLTLPMIALGLFLMARAAARGNVPTTDSPSANGT